MKINWKVRARNPVFWAHVATSVLLPVLAYFGMNWSDLTSWAAVGDLLIRAAGNPLVVVAVLTSVWNTVNDPTTPGISDSIRALCYKEPGVM